MDGRAEFVARNYADGMGIWSLSEMAEVKALHESAISYHVTRIVRDLRLG